MTAEANATVANPLLTDPAIAVAREELARAGIGQWLAVAATARARAPLADPLTALGLPLFDLLLATISDPPASVTAVHATAEPGFAHWSLILGFASGLRASVDIGAGIGPGQTRPLDLRVEYSGAERVILVDPTNVAVTVTTARGVSRRSAEVTPLADALAALDTTAAEAAWPAAARLVAASRRSAETGAPTPLE